MWCKKIFIAVVFAGMANAATAQIVQEPSTLEIYLENDFFNTRGDGTDRYYTNGVRVQYYFSKKKKNFPSNVLIRISDDKNVYSWGLTQNMFTPASIEVEEVQLNDRPYAGALYATHGLNSIDTEKRIRVSSEFMLGVIGPLSFAKETQTWVHNMFNYTIPEGWDNQVPNDIIINYNIQVEKQLMYASGKVLVNGIVETFNGTMYNAMSAGINMRVGRFHNYFEPNTASGKAQLFVHMKPSVRVVYSNALLQGGLISNISDKAGGYSLSKDQLERINAFYEIGLVYQRPKFGITVLQKIRTAEFKGGEAQEIGNISINARL